jgi:hypothetical protein
MEMYTNEGPIRLNEIYDGRKYDASKELRWNKAIFNDAGKVLL